MRFGLHFFNHQLGPAFFKIYVSVGQMAEIQLHPSYIFVALLPQPLKYLGYVLEGERHAFGGIWTIGRIKHGSGSPEISKCAMAIPGG